MGFVNQQTFLTVCTHLDSKGEQPPPSWGLLQDGLPIPNCRNGTSRQWQIYFFWAGVCFNHHFILVNWELGVVFSG